MNDAIPHMSGPGGGVVPRAQLPGVLLYHGPKESRYVLRRSLSDHLLFHLSSRLPLERSHLTGKGGGGSSPGLEVGTCVETRRSSADPWGGTGIIGLLRPGLIPKKTMLINSRR